MVQALERPSTNGNLPFGGKAAIYVRVSSHKQEDGASLDVQLETCRRYCEKTGFDVVGEFRDIESGLHVDRAQYQQALSLARAKGFDSLVVYRYDRTGRDDAEYAGMLRDFSKAGIQLVSASGESPDPLYQKLAGVLAWDESRRLSIRVSGSKMKRHTEGKWNGKPVFGYSIHQLRDDPRNCEVCKQHSPGGCILVPNEQAPLVTEMFQRYASGKHSLMDLRRFLNQSGVLKGRSGILYILTNRTYLGLAPHGRNVRSQFHPAPDQMDWSQGQHQPLTDCETFDRVQARLTDNRHRQRGGTSPNYLFSGMIYCGFCGGKYGGRHGDKSYNWYTCNRRIGFGDCQSHTVYESRIKEVVIPPIENLLGKLNREDVRTSVRAELVRQEEDAKSADVVTKLGAAETLERLETRLSNLEDDYLDRTIAKDRYLKRRDELISQIKELQAQLAARPHLALPNVDQLFAIADTITVDNLDDQAWRDIIEGMVDRIVIDGAESDGKKAPATIRVVWKPEYAPLLDMVEGS